VPALGTKEKSSSKEYLMDTCLRFLITETTLAARIIMRSQLIHLGHVVDMALDSASTLVLAETKTYHLIMLDTHINDESDCYGLIQKIRDNSNYNQATPIILIGRESEQLVGKTGCPYFAKPLNSKDLNKIIEYCNVVNNSSSPGANAL
jgi:DNA-binding response OmpR family regulator